jgi:DNA-binding SARP family transcriptional activator
VSHANGNGQRGGRDGRPADFPGAEHRDDTDAAALGPPLDVVCFGEPRVLYRGKRIWPPDSGRLKHWEVLLFLAARPTGSATRDQLWEALWPEKDPNATADPTNALRSQLHRLREAVRERAPDLPGGFVVLQRNGVCTLDPTLVTSDVLRFVALCEEARSLAPREAKAAYREARALYGDELLGGRPYAWLEERDESGLTLREVYAEAYRRATKELADLLLRDGEASAAIPLYRELLEAEPGVESLVRSLYRCYRQLRDRSGLVREERHLRQTLKQLAGGEDEPAPEPEPKTVALYERVMAELEATETAPAAG